MATLYFKIGADWDNVVRLRNEISKLETQLKNFGKYTPEQEIKKVENQLGAARQEFTRITMEAAKAGAAIDNDFKRKIFDASKGVNSLTERIISQKNVIKDIEADVRRLGEAYRNALKNERFGGGANNALAEYNAAKKALEEEKSALFALTQERATAQLSVKKLRDEYRLMKGDSEGSTEVLDEMTNRLKGWGAALLGGIGVKEFIGNMVRVRGEFQAADTSIRTLLGDKNEADELMSRVRKYAMVSPLEFSDLTKATQMMLGFNIEAEKVPRFLEAIGDVSMGDAQKFNSLTLAFSQMSAAGKLMGQDLNQMINAGFNPLQQISEKTGKSISELKDEMSRGAVSAEMVRQAFIDATSAGGRFYNMSENASKTINGQLSMMSDAMDNAFNEIGEKSEGLIIGGIKAATSLIGNYETIGKVLAGLIATYGTYKASLLAVMAVERLRSGTLLAGIAATKAYTVAQAALNAVMKANPYVLVATALVGVGTAMWALRDSTTDAEKAIRETNDALESQKNHYDEIKNKADSLTSAMSNESKSIEERFLAYRQLQRLMPNVFKDMDFEAAKRKTNAELIKLETDELLRQQRIGLKTKVVMSQQKIQGIENRIISTTNRGGYTGALNERLNAAKKELELYKEALDDLEKAKEESKKDDDKPVIYNKKYWEDRKKEAEEARSALDVSEQNSEKWKEYTRQIQDAQRQIDKYSDSKSSKTYGKQFENRQKLSDELLEIQRKNQQDEISLMEDGLEKKLAQIRFDYDSQKHEIEKQSRKRAKENKEAGITDVNANGLTYAQQEEMNKASDINIRKMNESINDLYKSNIDKYQSYTDQRISIEKKFNEDIALLQEARKRAEEQGDSDEVSKIDRSIAKATSEKTEVLAGIDDEAQKKTSIITKLFDDMSKKTVADMRLIADEAEKMLSYINSGEFKTDESGKGLFGLTKEQFDILSKSPEKLESIKNEIANVRNEADEAEPAFKKVGDGLKDIFSYDSVKLKKALQNIREGLDEIMQAGQFLSDSLSSLGDSLGIGALSGIADGINTAMGVMDSTMKGAEAGAMFGPIGSAAGAALGMVSSLSSAIAGIHDKKNEKRIQRLQDQIEALDKTYEKLGNSIEKAYSNDASDLIEDQNELLKQQKVLIQQQIREEEDKKKTDNGRINEWREQIDEINELIEENKEKAKDAIFGEDLKSAIENFADAYAEAWSSGEDKAKSAKDVVKNMIKNMIRESIKAAASDPMKAIREKLLEFWSDEYISEEEQAYIEKKAVELQEQLDRQFGWADSIMGGGQYSQQASGKGFETMSQDTGEELNGRFTALQASGEEIKSLTQITNEWLARIYAAMATGGSTMPDVSSEKAAIDKGQTNTTNVVLQDGKLNELVAEVVSMKSILDEVRTINANGSLERASIADGVSVLSKNSPKLLAAANDIKRNTD